MFKGLTRLVVLCLLATVAAVGSLFYRHHTSRDARIAKLEVENTRLQDVLTRLGTERRVADVIVTEQKAVDGKRQTTLLFVRHDKSGRPLPPKRFEVVGDRVHVDAKIVKFEPEAVEANDPLKGHAVLLFERVYGDAQVPAEAAQIDTPEAMPALYANADPAAARFEQDLWRQFWQLLDDEKLRKRHGVRVAHGVGVFAPFTPGNRYTVTLTPDGNVTLHSEPLPEIFRAAMERGVLP